MAILGIRAHDLGCMRAQMLARTARGQGLGALQLALAKALRFQDGGLPPLDDRLAEEVRQAMEENGVKIAVLSCYINPVNPDEAARERDLRKFEEYLAFAGRVGAGLVGTETGSYNADCSPHPWNRTDEAFDILVSSLARLARRAEECGVDIGIEGVVRHTAYSPVRMRALFDRVGSERVKVIFDPVNLLSPDNAYVQQAVIDQCVALFGGRIRAVHLKDFVLENGDFRAVPVGQGQFDFAHLVRCIASLPQPVDYIFDEVAEGTLPSCKAYFEKILAENAGK